MYETYANISRFIKIRSNEVQLNDMLAYKVAMLASDLSGSLAREYEAYQLTMPEWRVMATLGACLEGSQSKYKTAKEIAHATRLDKVQVSRAIERLNKNGVVIKRLSKKDKRSSLIALSKDGKAMYEQIIPRVVEWQNKRLENITDDEYRVFLKVIEALTP